MKMIVDGNMIACHAVNKKILLKFHNKEKKKKGYRGGGWKLNKVTENK